MKCHGLTYSTLIPHGRIMMVPWKLYIKSLTHFRGLEKRLAPYTLGSILLVNKFSASISDSFLFLQVIYHSEINETKN